MISTKDFNMARVTNSDTLPYVDSRYELGMLASQRVRDLNGGVEAVVEKKDDKLTVVALREIASGKLNIEEVRHEFIESYKDTHAVSESDTALEIASEDPTLRDVDNVLDNNFVTEDLPVADSAEEVVINEEDDTPDEAEDEE
jgi:DNA-directed RNA polymerase subunit omega